MKKISPKEKIKLIKRLQVEAFNRYSNEMAKIYEIEKNLEKEL